jgi:hypothetical protein
MAENTNPLSKYYRQPQIYIKLPSEGKWYPPDVFTSTETGEIPVLPMTAKDELAFKTPDALMNGQATVDVIKSCIPNFKNPWKMVNFDTDTILLGIRIATYGETMDINYVVPITNEQATTTVNLPAILDGFRSSKIEDVATTKSKFKVKLNPLDYQILTKISTAQFEQQKMYTNVNTSTLSEEEKSKQFSKSFQKLNNINFDLLVESINTITTPEGFDVNDKVKILEFMNNCPAKLVEEIQNELGKIRVQAQVKPIKIKATEKQIKNGVPATFEVPITFDQSNFFA